MRCATTIALLLATPVSMLSTTPVLSGRCSSMRRLVSEPLLKDDSMDTPGVLWLEHLNLIVGDRATAEKFFINFLGFVAEPGKSFHVNLGGQQLHLASAATEGEEHRLTGTVGLAVPSLAAIRGRCEAARTALAGTCFDVADHGESISVVCPWGNSYVCYDAVVERGTVGADVPKMEEFHIGLDESMSVRGGPGIRFQSFRVRSGTAARIGRFYEEMLGCCVSYASAAAPDGAAAAEGGAVAGSGAAKTATVTVGPSVHLIFTEEDGPLTDEQELRQAGPGGGIGLHICIYISDFKKTFHRFEKHGLTWTNPRFRHLDRCDNYEEAAASRQFRFRHILDLETSEPLLELEHEVRATRHFQFMKRTHYPAA